MKNDTIYILFILFLMGLPIASLGLYTMITVHAENVKLEKLNTKGVEYSPLTKQILKNIAEEKKLKDTQENK